MYEVVSIDEALRTSFIKLKNCETGTIDECFDDSSVGCDNNFCFMKVGVSTTVKYNCWGMSYR